MDIKQIRLKNLRALFTEMGSIANVARASGTAEAYLSQISNGVPLPSGRPRGVGDALARKLEVGCSKPRGWMDASHDSESNQSQLVPTHASIRTYDSIDELDQQCYVQVERFNVKLSAGSGQAVEWIPERVDPLVFRKNWFERKGYAKEYCKAMYIRGDSMEPFLCNWDTVLIDTSDTELTEGDIFAVIFNTRLYIKKIAFYADGVKLVSLNDKYDPITVPNSEAEKFTCLGKMVWRGG